MNILLDVESLAEEETRVNGVIWQKLENLVYKYRCDIKELKWIIIIPWLHEKYVIAVKQR